MNLLSRNEILSLLEQDKQFISDEDGFFQKGYNQTYTKDSHIQQCSVDLHIGNIYLPEIEDHKPGGCENPLTDDYVLNTGNTALIRTKEKVKMPPNIAGICFSPSWITLKGILITNMGHVDPGYEGHLHFTVINMGKMQYILRPKDPICTFLLFQLNEDTFPWGKEKFEKGKIIKDAEVPKLVKKSLPKLSTDFLDFEKRSSSIAEKAAKEETRKSKFYTLLYTVGVPIVVAAILTFFSFSDRLTGKPWEKQILDLDSRIKSIEYNTQMNNKLKELEEIKRKIFELENKLNQKTD